jgi:DNA-binding NarL/FixJ family response regulator
MENINIVIADDHPMVIDGLKAILSTAPYLCVTNCYTNGIDLQKSIALLVADVLLLDIQMPGKSGDELLPLILKQRPDIKVLILTNFDSAIYVNNLMQKGAHGYMLKTTDRKILIESIKSIVHDNGKIIDEELIAKVDKLKAKGKLITKIRLTAREKEILQLIVNGFTNTEIANKVFLSSHTIDNYRDSILLKLDVKNTASMVKKALQLGLVE